MKIRAFTDGSCNWKNGLGGSGALLQFEDGSEYTLNCGLRNTKTGRSELRAILLVLTDLPEDESIDLTIYSDSQYVVKSINENRLERWIEQGFEYTANSDLWNKFLDEYLGKDINLTIHHIKGHQVDKEKDPEKKIILMKDPIIAGNKRADELADYKQFTDRITDINDKEWELVKSNKG